MAQTLRSAIERRRMWGRSADQAPMPFIEASDREMCVGSRGMMRPISRDQRGSNSSERSVDWS